MPIDFRTIPVDFKPEAKQIDFKQDIERDPNLLVDIPQQFATGVLNEAFLGFPLLAIEKSSALGPEIRKEMESKTKAGRVARGVGSAAGFVFGAPGQVLKVGGKVAIKGAKLLRGGRQLGKFAEAGIRGAGVFGLYEAVRAPEEDFNEKVYTVPMATILGAGFGVTAKALEPVFSNIIKSIRGGSRKTVAALTRVKRRSVFHNELVTNERGFLRDQGRGGIALTQKLDNIRDVGEIRAGQSIANFNKMTKGMTKKELLNFVDVTEGKAVPLNNKVTNLAKFWRTEADKIAQEASKRGLGIKNGNGEVLNFKSRKNYFPHITIETDAPPEIVNTTLNAAVKRGDFKNIESARTAWESYRNVVKTRKGGKAILNYLVRTGRASNEAEAEVILNKFITRNKIRRFGNLELAREVDLPFYDVDPENVVPRYFTGVFHRLEEVKNLGIKDELLQPLFDKISKDGGDVLNARVAFERWSGKEQQRFAFGAISPDFSRKVRSVEAVTKLGLAAIPNSTQSINTAFVTGIKNTTKGVRKALTKEGQDFALRTGSTLRSTLDSALQGATGGIEGFAKRFLKVIGFTGTEKMNRVISANAGREYALELTKKIIRNPGSNAVRRAMREIGLSPTRIANRGSITTDEMLRAAQRVVNKTQFRSGVLDLPLFFTSPEGRVMTQFKTFAFNQAKLLKDALLVEATRGNLRPLITAVAIMPILGEGVRGLRSILSGRVRDKRGLDRLVENVASVGGLGIFSDIWQSSSIGKTTQALAGPALSDISQFIEGIVKAAQGKPKTLIRTGARQVPVVGPLLKNLLR